MPKISQYPVASKQTTNEKYEKRDRDIQLTKRKLANTQNEQYERSMQVRIKK